MFTEFLSQGFLYYLRPDALLFTFLGVFIGMIIGVLPGLGPLLGIILATPIVIGLEPLTAMSTLIGVYVGGACGGAISAVLLKIPGTPINAATVLDGFPMAKKGKSSLAVGLSITASAYGGIIGGLYLIFFTPALAMMAMKFSPPEYFALAVTGVVCIIIVSKESLLKGVMMGVLGLFASTVGFDPFVSVSRFTFGTVYLMGGISLVATVLGLYAVSEMMHQIAEGGLKKSRGIRKVGIDREAILLPFKQWINLLRSSTIGTFIGALPGVGAVIAALIAYSAAKSSSKTPEKFGTGIADGVIATEASNNACVGGSLIPVLSLAIPGTATAALLMAALMLLGYMPGVELFAKSPKMVGGIFLAYSMANVFLLISGILFTPLFVSSLNVKKQYLIPIVLLLCGLGSYGVETNSADMLVMLLFAILGIGFLRNGYPLAPFVLAQVLGPLIEFNFRRSLAMSRNSFMIFIERPITAAILLINIVAFIAVLFPLKKIVHKKNRQHKESEK